MAIIRLAPDLKPEYSHSLSASVDLYHNFGRVQANLLVEGFYTMLEDVFTLEKIGEDAQGNIIKERRNASGATVAGVGAEAKAGIPGRFELQLGYTFQRSRYDEPEKWSDDVTPQRRMFRCTRREGSVFFMPSGWLGSEGSSFVIACFGGLFGPKSFRVRGSVTILSGETTVEKNTFGTSVRSKNVDGRLCVTQSRPSPCRFGITAFSRSRIPECWRTGCSTIRHGMPFPDRVCPP